MYTFHQKTTNRMGGLFALLFAVIAFCAGSATRVSAQIPPPNDNLANAQPILGDNGTIIGTNLNATAELNEPDPVFGNPAQASIWYIWRAPYTTTMSFNTRGSIDPNTGDDLDTVMAVYQYSNSVAFSNLTQIASDDDDPSGGVVSRVDVPVVAGSNYLIQIDGSSANTMSGSNAQGIVILNWGKSLVGGDFGFSSSVFMAGAFDDYMYVDFSGNPMAPSLHDYQNQGTNNIRITVSRTGGYTGKCSVALQVTNTYYINTYITNVWGTNIYSTNINTSNNSVSWTNSFITNYSTEVLAQNYINVYGLPSLVQEVGFSVFNTVLSNSSTSSPFFTASNVSLTGLGLTNFFTNFPGTNANQWITNASTNSGIVSITITQVFVNFITNYGLVQSASNNLDYADPMITNLVFNDFQMSQDFYIQINPGIAKGLSLSNSSLTRAADGAEWPGSQLVGTNLNNLIIQTFSGTNTNSVRNNIYYGINPLVSLSITNVTLDPGENPDITPPTMNGANPNSFLCIETFGGLPSAYYTQGGYYLTTNGPIPNFGTLNLERATFRINKSSSTAYLYLVAQNISRTASYTFHYTIDSSWLRVGTLGPVQPGAAFDSDFFNTVAASDYAQPDFNGVTAAADFSQPINQPRDPTPLNVGQFDTWPAGPAWVGTFTIQPAPVGPYALIAIPILNNGAVEFDEDFQVEIYETPADHAANIAATDAGGGLAPCFLGNISSANVTINFAGAEPGGANDISFNVDGSSSSYPPNNKVPGANGGAVKAIAIQANGQSVIGGYFSSYNTTPVYGVARLLSTGFLDNSFNPVSLPGVNYGGYVNAIAIDSLGRIIIGGSFTSYDGTNAINIARLTSTGALDPTFQSGIGFNGPVDALDIDTNGNILVGGEFTSYNTTNCNRIARLMTNGGLDMTFIPNTGNGLAGYGADATVRAIATDSSGNIILGGDFLHVGGSNLIYVARLQTNGAVDPGFNPEIGPDGTVYSVAVRSDNEILIGGAFQSYNLYSRAGVALLQTSGAVDTGFTPGTGVNGVVYSAILQPNNDVVIGGQFNNVNGSRRLSVARLLPSGWVDTSFMDTGYNQFAGLVVPDFNDPLSIAYTMALQSDGNIMIGGSFTNVGGGSARDDVHTKLNVARLIGTSTVGPQTGGGGIGNCPGNITFTQNPYTVDDTAPGLYVTIARENGSLGPAQVTLGTNLYSPGPGSATPADFGLKLPDIALFDEIYNHWWVQAYGSYGWRQADGFYGDNINIQPPIGGDKGYSALNLVIHNNKSALQNLTAGLTELNVNALDLFQLGGVSIPLYPALGTPNATLEIINDNFPPGFVGFSQTNFIAIDTSNSVTISVVRTNGTYGPISVYYYTANGTAISGLQYTGSPTPSSRTQLTFNGGNSANVATFTIPIIPQSTVTNSRTFKIMLTQANPSSALDTNVPPTLFTNATVTIIDGVFSAGHLAFTAPTYSALKGGVATIGVQRLGGALGQLQVQVVTSNGTATNGLNYTAVTNTLLWTNQDTGIKTITVQTLQDNTVEGPKTVNLALINATNIGNTSSNNLILTSPSTAVLTIVDTDSYGDLSFVVPNFNILQNAGQALITVVRTNGTTGTISASYTTLNSTNVLLPSLPGQAGTNYGATNGTLTFGPGVTSQSFIVPIYYTPTESNVANRVVTLELFGGSPSAVTNQFPVFASLTILDNQLINNPAGSVDQTTQSGTGFNGPVNSLALQPDGKILAGGNFTFFNQYPFNNVARLTAAGNYDTNFLFNMTGANGPVSQILSQPPNPSQLNGPVLIAGDFTQVDVTTRGGVARLNVDGSIDETFSPGSGADNSIFAVASTAVQTGNTNQPPALAYYLAGNFANYDGTPSGGITRVNAATNSPGYQGNPDPNFSVGQGLTGNNSVIRALGVQANGQVIAAGDFTSFDGVTYNHLVRLNPDGSVDSTFTPSTGTNATGSVRAVAVQSDGRILVGGLFTNVNGVNCNHLARLNSDGTLDTNFNVGVGGDNSVLTIALDSQQRILVGGEFSHFSGVTRNGITRLNPDGTVDPTINFQSGADGGYVDAIAIDRNDEIDLGGGFSSFEGMAENNFVRLYGGANAGEGTIQFSQAVYGVLQNGTNATVLIQRLGGEGTTLQPTVSITFSTSDGSGTAGVDYTNITTNLTFPLGETYQTVTIPIINNVLVGSNRTVNLTLSSPVLAGLGVQSTAVLIITNVNSAVSFSAQTYNQSANAPGGSAIIPIVRIGNPNSTVSVTVYTGTNGSATPFTNYIPQTNILVFNPGVLTNYFLVPIINATNMFSDQTVDLEMSNSVGAFLGAPSSATLTINSVFKGPGVISFAQTNFAVSEGGTNAIITLIRSNGSFGTVTVTLTTSNGTAISGVNYAAISTNVVFGNSESNESIAIPVYQQTNGGPDLTVYLTLSSPTGGATIGGLNPEILTIQNDIENFSFANAPYFVNEGAGSVTLSIVRGGPASNTASVQYTTFTPPNVSESNGYALPNVDYVPASGTLVFGPNVSFTTIPITILQGNTPNGPLGFQVILSTPTPSGVQIGTPGTAAVTILSDVTGFQFSSNVYFTPETNTPLVVWVNRLNPATGAASVQFATSDGTAVNQIDYVATNGTLNFADGQASNSFTVAIRNPNLVENNKSFNLALSNPKVLTFPNPSTNAYLVSPSNAVVTITNLLTGVSFSSSAYTVSECAAYASIPIVLTGNTNNTVTVIAATTNGGTASAGTNYFSATNAFTLQPGQTSTNFLVQINNNHIIGPDHTVVLTLSSPTGAQLINPSTAILTIQECNGAFIVKSGTAFVSGNQSPAGSIMPNETVTLLFGLRDVSGTQTTNLVATLLSTNGVTNVSAAQSYGALVPGGPTTSRAFTFTAIGTNGQNIVANFALTDGSQVYSNVAFGFTLGTTVFSFSTNEVLNIVGSSPLPAKAYNNNPPNYGYPSQINVQGIAGSIMGVTATISNFGHTFPADVTMVLEAPGGQDSYLMCNCGGGNPVSHANLTFSQNAGASLPQNSTITTGTYLPTAYAAMPLLLTNNAPKGPYPASLAGFAGIPANGTWSLFVVDEDTLDSGYISNGWSLNINTGVGVEEDSDLGLTVTSAPAFATLSNTLVYSVSVTNYGPAAATNIIITDTLPAGATYVSNSCSCVGGTNGVLVYTVPTLAVGSGTSFSFSVIPTSLGYLTNIAVAIADQPDPNSNNIQTNVALVSPTSADLGVTLTGPNPVLDGGTVTYTVTASNAGPSTATGVTAVDILPSGFLPLTLTPSQGTASNANGVITWNIGTLGSVTNTKATLTIAAGVSLPEAGLPSSTSLDTVTISSQVYDPAKANNFASVKTQVQPASISVTATGSTYVLSWPVGQGNTILQGTVTLAGPWVPITNSSIVPQIIGGQTYDTFTLPGTNGYHFFRLLSQLP
jgi:uncharacterized repeat protein (TIGR01451 family)/uncharacterized delta-60 repeat protein